MLYRITIKDDYLKADLFNRRTVEETREFFDAVSASAFQHGRTRILISVHASNPTFMVDRSGFLADFRRLSADPSHRIALVADSSELDVSHQYIEKLGQQRGINVKCFRDEGSGLAWFSAQG